MTELPFLDHALGVIQHDSKVRAGNGAHAATLLALAALAEYDLRTGHGVPVGYNAAQVGTVTGGARSTVQRRLARLADGGYVATRLVAAPREVGKPRRLRTVFRPLEVSA